MPMHMRTLEVVALVEEVLLHPLDELPDHLLVAHTGRDHQRGFAGAVQTRDRPPRLEGKRWVLDEVVG